MDNIIKYEKSCGAVIFHKFETEYKVLLIGFIHGGELRWGFPKGHMENNETEIETAMREINEEVGIDVKIIPGFRETTNFSCKTNTVIEAIYYCAKADSTEASPQDEEVEKTAWLNFEQAHKYLTYECDKKVFSKFIEFFNTYNQEKEKINEP